MSERTFKLPKMTAQNPYSPYTIVVIKTGDTDDGLPLLPSCQLLLIVWNTTPPMAAVLEHNWLVRSSILHHQLGTG